jgi:hypothetical protein
MQCIPEELGKFAECHGVIRNHKNNPVIILDANTVSDFS